MSGARATMFAGVVAVITAGVTTAARTRPALAAPACGVTITRAPSEVRAIVERWLADDGRCGEPLEVQIEPRDGALVLLARDARGKVRERTVPAADDAGLLIASWAADDRLEAAGAPRANAPDEASVSADAADASPTPTAPPRWISLGAYGGLSRVGGASEYGTQIAADVVTWRGWTLGGSVGLQHVYAAANQDTETASATNVRVLATVSRTLLAVDGVRLRASLGFGGMYVTGSDRMAATETASASSTSFDGVVPVGSLSVLAGYEWNAWSFEVGPMAVAYLTAPADDPEMLGVRYWAELTLFAGVRHAL